MKRGVLTLFLFAFLPSFVFSQVPLTLDEAIRIALEKSPTLAAQREVIREAEYKRKEALSKFFPKLEGKYYYLRLDETPKMVIPPLKGRTLEEFEEVLTYPLIFKIGTRDNWGLDLSVSLPVFTGGALRNGYGLACLGVESSKLQYELSRLDLILKVREAFYNVIKAKRLMEVAQKALEALKEHHRVAQAFYQQGIIPKNDLLQVEVELSQREQDLIAAQKNLEMACYYFNILLRRPLNEEVILDERLDLVGFEEDFGSLLKKALENRPELKLGRIQIEAAKKEFKIARSELLPKVSLLFDYQRQGDDPSVSGSPYREKEYSWQFMAVLQWRLWDFGESYFGVKEKQARIIEAENQLKEIEDLVTLQVGEAFLSVREAMNKVKTAQKALEGARENFRVNEERYKLQAATSSDVLDALALLVRAQNSYWIALCDYHLALGRLKRAMGVER
jgi:outer membrane protein TolC